MRAQNTLSTLTSKAVFVTGGSYNGQKPPGVQRWLMKRYMIFHTLPADLTPEKVQELAQSSQEPQGVRGLRSYMNFTERTAVCIFEAESRQKIEKFFSDHKMAFDRIVPIEWEGERGETVEVIQAVEEESIYF